MNQLFIKDYERFTTHAYSPVPALLRRWKNHSLAFIYYGRKLQLCKTRLGRLYYTVKKMQYRRKYGLEMNFSRIGGGLRLTHPWCITVNSQATLGENVTLFKGATIGSIEHGKKAGFPTLGNNVIVYANATVCGKITIGDNVEIAAGSFVNFDVPPNSVVIGNPGVIHVKNY